MAFLNSEFGRILNCKPYLYNCKSGNDRFLEIVIWDSLIQYGKLGTTKVKPIHDKSNNEVENLKVETLLLQAHFFSKLSREQFLMSRSALTVKRAWTNLQTYCIFVVSGLCLCLYTSLGLPINWYCGVSYGSSDRVWVWPFYCEGLWRRSPW